MLYRLLLCLFVMVSCAVAAVSTTDIDYSDEDVALRGTLARPVTKDVLPRPAVLVVHEWWGLNDYAKRRASELAELGYVAFALDMYGAGKNTQDPKQAGEWAGPFYKDHDLLLRRARAGLAQLAKQPGVQPSRVGAMGFCFGGTVCLELARAGDDLAGVVSFHGGLKTGKRAEPGTIKAKLLILHGGADSFVPPTEVADFIDEMTKAKAIWRMQIFGGALHAFTNPAAATLSKQLPIDYDPDAEKRSMAAMRDFFTDVLAAR